MATGLEWVIRSIGLSFLFLPVLLLCFLFFIYHLRNNHKFWMPLCLRERGTTLWICRSPNPPVTFSLLPENVPDSRAQMPTATGAAGGAPLQGCLSRWASPKPPEWWDGRSGRGGARGVGVTRGLSVHHLSRTACRLHGLNHSGR